MHLPAWANASTMRFGEYLRSCDERFTAGIGALGARVACYRSGRRVTTRSDHHQGDQPVHARQRIRDRSVRRGIECAIDALATPPRVATTLKNLRLGAATSRTCERRHSCVVRLSCDFTYDLHLHLPVSASSRRVRPRRGPKTRAPTRSSARARIASSAPRAPTRACARPSSRRAAPTRSSPSRAPTPAQRCITTPRASSRPRSIPARAA